MRDTIKSHHNVGGLPERMNLKLVEPIRDLFKDEVKKIGKELNTPESVLKRHPFPGPGLGIRIMGEVTKDRIDVLQKADKIFIDELAATIEDKEAGIDGTSKLWDQVRKGLDWFRQHNAEAYMVLLD